MNGAVPAARLISVVMPVHENLGQLRLTLPAILDQRLPEGLGHEVVVVDDGSGPAVRDWLAGVADPRCRVVTLPENRGRAAARNAGVRAAAGEWVALLDSDMLVRPDFLAAHAETLAGGADISLGGFVDADDPEAALRRPPPPALPGPGRFTSANVAIRRDLLEAVRETEDGPFDARTFDRYGWEDLDLEQRLNRLRPRRRRAARATGLHLCPPFAPDLLPAMIGKEIDRARMARRFLAKHPTWPVRLVTQATPLHRALWEALSLGGLLNERSLGPLLGWLVRRGRRGLAAVIARNAILSPTYVRHL